MTKCLLSSPVQYQWCCIVQQRLEKNMSLQAVTISTSHWCHRQTLVAAQFKNAPSTAGPLQLSPWFIYTSRSASSCSRDTGLPWPRPHAPRPRLRPRRLWPAPMAPRPPRNLKQSMHYWNTKPCCNYLYKTNDAHKLNDFLPLFISQYISSTTNIFLTSIQARIQINPHMLYLGILHCSWINLFTVIYILSNLFVTLFWNGSHAAMPVYNVALSLFDFHFKPQSHVLNICVSTYYYWEIFLLLCSHILTA